MKNTLLLFLALFNTFYINSQDDQKTDNIKEMSEDACECISKIDIMLDTEMKSKKISSCIQSASIANQLKSSLTGILEGKIDSITKEKNSAKVDSLVLEKGSENIIVSGKDYKEIEKDLYKNCPQLKKIYFSNDEQHENSFSDKEKAKKFYNQGQKAFARQNYKDAIKYFKKATNKDNNFAFAWDNLGYSYRKTGEYKKAIVCYKKSLALDPKGKMPLMNIAVAYELDNDLEGAKKSYENFKNLYENDPEPYYGIGRIYYLEKDYEPALDNMIKAYLLYQKMESPYSIDAQKHVGFIYQALKKADNLALFNKIAKKYNLNVNIED